MNKRVIVVGVVVLFLGFVVMFSVVPTLTGFSVFQGSIDEQYLESLRAQANVECLQNSQCSEGFECVDMKCVEDSKIDLCQEVKLSTPTRYLSIGSPLNSIKRVITSSQLPYLLHYGLIVDNLGEELIKHEYVQMILIGENRVGGEIGDYVIKSENGKPVYTLRVIFSKAVDFSDKNIRGQTLKILGEEYVIGSASNNDAIQLISDSQRIKLSDGKNVERGLFSTDMEGNSVKLIKNSFGDVLSFEIEFNMNGLDSNEIKAGEFYGDPVFDKLKLSLGDSNSLVDVMFGGKCI